MVANNHSTMLTTYRHYANDMFFLWLLSSVSVEAEGQEERLLEAAGVGQ